MVSPRSCLVSVLLLLALPARASETWITVYVGLSVEQASDVHVRLGEDDLTYHGVSWESRNLEWPIFYGIRVVHWFDTSPSPGLMLDFVHDKAYAEATTPVHVTGTRGGAPVDATEPLATTVQRFNMSHGANLVTLSAVLRPWAEDGVGGFDPWIGVGGGFQLPHVEATTSAGKTADYEFTGGTVQALVGVRAPATWTVAPSLEYRFARAHYADDIAGGTLETTLLHHQLELGASVALGR